MSYQQWIPLRFFAAWLETHLTEASASDAAQPLRLAIISEGLQAWPLYVATGKRLFDKAGVHVELTLTGSSVTQLERLIDGGFDIGFQQSDHVVRAVERGSDLFIFMAQGYAPDLSLVVAPGIKAFADLKGKVIAVDGARTGYALLLRKLLAENGLGDGDYEIREFGGSRERFDALTSGAAASSLLNPPFDRNLFAAGFGSLGAINDFYPLYPGPIAATRRSWAKRNGKQLIAFIRGFSAGFAWLQDPANKAEAIQLLPARLNISAEAASKAYDRYATRGMPQLTSDGLRQVIDVVWEAEGLKSPQGAPGKYLDLSYQQRAESAQ
ncbi:MAG: ABC transporter substrate-binding protein [Burkholderiales bacterium]|nr:ABC transporter substrate-binding protein [Burkholderiales bacterium]